jgi:hypothetical protein
MYSYKPPLTSALDGVDWSTPRPGRITLTNDPVPLYRRLGGFPGPARSSAENITPTGFDPPDRPARRESLYRLSYPGPFCMWVGTEENKENSQQGMLVDLPVL